MTTKALTTKTLATKTLGTDARVIGRIDWPCTPAERDEMIALGVADAEGRILQHVGGRAAVPRTVITSLDVLNEAHAYQLPSSFSRGLATTVRAGQRILWLSGTASIDAAGRTVHAGDFRAQLWRTYRNLTQLLRSEGATWHDVVRTSCYLRDIERDYDEFNRVRTLFLRCMSVDPLPASTGIQARLCRSDLLIEIEGFAIVGAVAGG